MTAPVLRMVGFTGTSGTKAQPSMRIPQAEAVQALLLELRGLGATKFTHGCCTGADEDAASYARFYGYRVIGQPGRPPRDPYRCPDCLSHRLLPVPPGKSPELTRNRRIAAADVLVAAPHHDHEVLRSGEWSTIREARRLRRPVAICWPDGTILRERWPA